MQKQNSVIKNYIYVPIYITIKDKYELSNSINHMNTYPSAKIIVKSLPTE